MFEDLIAGSEFEATLDRKGIPPATWLRERQEEGKGLHWIAATLHNAGVCDYSEANRALASEIGTDYNTEY